MKALINGRIYAFDPVARVYARHSVLVIDGGTIVSVGAEAPTGIGCETIDLAGATVLPAFTDCHVHLADTGYSIGPRDLSGTTDAESFARAVAAIPRDGEIVYAARYDDARWTDGAAAKPDALERAHSGALAMLVRIDGHSSMVNQRTFRELALDASLAGIERDVEGDPTGRLFLEANWIAQARFRKRIPTDAYRAASQRAAQLALSEGAVHLHAQLIELGSHDAYAQEVAFLRSLEHVNIHPKICERDPALAAKLGLPYIGGDVFLDGSLGSGTAATCAPYHDRDGCGTLILSDDEVFAYFSESERLGVSAGVHAIGDRAIEQALATWERVLGGKPSARCRHFIEHFELASPEQIARAGKLGLYLSVQPQFDATWGAPGGMYDARLSRNRAATMNAFASARDAGAILCGGDDAPVCTLSPRAGMSAACEHHTPTERLAPHEALTMYAYDAARFGFAESRTGRLAPGFDADLAVLDSDPLDGETFTRTRVLQTWSRGSRAFYGTK